MCSSRVKLGIGGELEVPCTSHDLGCTKTKEGKDLMKLISQLVQLLTLLSFLVGMFTATFLTTITLWQASTRAWSPSTNKAAVNRSSVLPKEHIGSCLYDTSLLLGGLDPLDS